MIQMKRVFFATALFFAMAAQSLAATITITGTVTDAQGSAPFSVTVTTTTPDVITVSPPIVAPAVGPPGTARTLTVVGSSSAGLALSATLNAVPGITFTPVSGQPAGTFVWTFVF